jgi:MFS family permease
MLRSLRGHLGESLATFRDVFRNPNLRRIQLAFVGSITGDWAFGVAAAVYAYEHGGAAAVGLIGLIRWLPSAVVAPFSALLGDRYRRERVMLGTDLTRASLMGAAAAAALLGAPSAAVFALAGSVQVVATAFRPAQAALLPSLATRPEELTAANVASSSIESVGSFAGPALGGLMLGFTSPGVVFATTAGLYLWSALNVSRIRTEVEREREPAAEMDFRTEAAAGFRAIAHERDLRVVVFLYTSQTLVAGALNVLIVVTALQLLDIGRSGVGFLNSGIGVGGVIGALVAIALVGRRRLAQDFGFGLLFWGIPIALIGVWPNYAVAFLLLTVVGLGNTLVDVAGLTLLQRTVSDAVLARVFGVLESLILGSIGLGAIIAPALIAGLGIRTALIVAGSFLPLLALVSWRRLAQIDATTVVPEHQLALLRANSIFAPLPGSTLEHLATALDAVEFAAAETIFRQGDPGDRFYLVDRGEVEVSVDGGAPVVLGPGDYFGEIALLRGIPRTATVTARTAVDLLALDRDEFIAAVTGHAPSAEAADAVIGARLGGLRSGVASV